MKSRSKLTTALLLATALPAIAAAPDLDGLDPQAAGDALIDHADEYHKGWINAETRAELELYDAQGTRSVREIRTYEIEHDDGNNGGQFLVIYDSPGNGLLTHMSRSTDDLQWLWVSGLRRLRRLESNGMNGSFVGSEYTYEDMRSQYPRKFQNTLVETVVIDGVRHWVIDRVPNYSNSGYSRMRVYLEPEHFRVNKTEFFDPEGRPLKVALAEDWRLEDGKHWRAHRTRMSNLKTGRYTVWLTRELKLGTGLSDLRRQMR